MAQRLADKYRDKVNKGTDVYRKGVQKQKDSMEALEREKKKAAERWKKQQQELDAVAKGLEQSCVEMWGSVVLASGFADRYPDGFEKLQELLEKALGGETDGV